MIDISLVELYLNDGRCIPLLTLKRDNKNVLHNLNYLIEVEKDTKYFLDFRYDIFDSLSQETINFFDKEIFSHSTKGYLDKESWSNTKSKFKLRSLINEKENLKKTKKLIRNIKNNFNRSQPVIKYVSNEELKEICSNDDYNINDNIIENFGHIIPDRKIMITEKQDNESSEKYLLLYFLNAVFLSYYNFKIMKCKNCNKFFFAQKSDTLYCDRIFQDNKTCKNFIICKNLQNGKGLFPELSKRIYETQKKKGLSHQFLEKEKKILRMFPNDKKKHVEFYLSFYTNTTNGNNAKRKTINDFNLNPYLTSCMKNRIIRKNIFFTSSFSLVIENKSQNN